MTPVTLFDFHWLDCKKIQEESLLDKVKCYNRNRKAYQISCAKNPYSFKLDSVWFTLFIKI